MKESRNLKKNIENKEQNSNRPKIKCRWTNKQSNQRVDTVRQDLKSMIQLYVF